MKSTITSSDEILHSIYEDPDMLMPAVIDGDQPQVKVKPVPRPRSKLQSKTQQSTTTNHNNNIITANSVDETSNTTNAVCYQSHEHPAEHNRPHPVRPPPPIPLSTATEAVEGSSHYERSNAEPTEKPLAPSTEQQTPPPRPKPPPVSSYYDRLRIATSPECEATGCPNRPVIPPRLQQSTLHHSASGCETSPPQSKPPPPPLNPPPPRSGYRNIEYRSYLQVLSEDSDQMRSTLPSGQKYQNGCYFSQRLATEDDTNGLLRWLKKMSKSDSMAPSLYGLSIEEEIGCFHQRAMDVTKALRLYNLLMMRRKETLQNIIMEFRSISGNLDKLQKKNKTMGIAGGTTGAVGGVTVVVGLALAPMTMGASLIATAVGAGMVASAGGMGAHAAKASKKAVNRMNVEKLINDYKTDVVDLECCLDFILSGMNELRRHDVARLQRAGAHRDAMRMAHLSQDVFRDNVKNSRGMSVARTGGVTSDKLLQAFEKEMDQYFTKKDSQKLKKSNKSRFSGRICLLAENLQDELDHLTRMWEMFS